MKRYMLRRVIFLFISLFGATMVVFGLSQMAQDPRELFIPEGGYSMTDETWDALGAKYGFDKPVPIRYALWMGRALTGDLGTSLSYQEPVTTVIASRMGATIQLAILAWIFAISVGVVLGVLAAVKRATLFDYLGRGFALFGQALPPFWTGIVAIFLFAVTWELLPSSGRGPTDEFFFSWTKFRHMVLPSIVLGWPAAAGIMRLTRSAMLDILDSEFIKLARAKGVSNNAVIFKHALRNSLIPPLTSAFLLFAGYLNGALVVETVFAYRGIGWVALNKAVYNNDFPLLLGTVFLFMIFYAVFALIADLSYVFIDPRIRYS